MSEKETNKKEDEELGKLRGDILMLQEIADKNYHWRLLKQWLLAICVWGISIFISFVISYFKKPPIGPIEPSKIEEIIPVIFSAIVTINGLIIGFVPLISFFYIREVRERERDYEQIWEEEQKRRENEKLKLINTYYNLLLMLSYNIRSGVLRYTRTYVLVSVILQFALVLSYIVTVGYGIAGLCGFIDLTLLYVIITGLLPIIGMALYQPTLKFVRYFVGKEIVRIEAES